jgi:hypothetical protein
LEKTTFSIWKQLTREEKQQQQQQQIELLMLGLFHQTISVSLGTLLSLLSTAAGSDLPFPSTMAA